MLMLIRNLLLYERQESLFKLPPAALRELGCNQVAMDLGAFSRSFAGSTIGSMIGPMVGMNGLARRFRCRLISCA
jgi:hypothetical protein